MEYLISLLAVGVGIFTILYFNKKSVVFNIKRDVILKSLEFLNNYLSHVFKSEGAIASSKGFDDLTHQARACFSELHLVCKNEELLNTFMMLIFPEESDCDLTSLSQHTTILYQTYHNLCREELGLKELSYDYLRKRDIFYIGRVGIEDNDQSQL